MRHHLDSPVLHVPHVTRHGGAKLRGRAPRACLVAFAGLALAVNACGGDPDEPVTMVTSTSSAESSSSAADSDSGSEPAAAESSESGGIGSDGAVGADASSDPDVAWGYTLTGGVEAAASGATLVLSVGVGTGSPGGSVVFRSVGRSASAAVAGQYHYGGDATAVGDHMAIQFSVRLADSGMTCGNNPRQGVFMTVTAIDGSDDSYYATFSGPVVCEDGTEAMVEGFLRRRD